MHERIDVVRALWEAAVPGMESPPVCRYLARRRVWPAPCGFGSDWPEVPCAIRWARRDVLTHVCFLHNFPAAYFLHEFPADAAGVLLAGYFDVPDREAVRAATMDALTENGERVAGGWRTLGEFAGAACVMQANPDGSKIAIVDGECDALAVSLMARAGILGDVAEVRAVNGPSGFQADRAADRQGRSVLLLPYGKGTGALATREGEWTKSEWGALECAAQLCQIERDALVDFRSVADGEGSPACDLAVRVRELVCECIARPETQGQEEAEREAWRRLLSLPGVGGGRS